MNCDVVADAGADDSDEDDGYSDDADDTDDGGSDADRSYK